jgi:hypothetical protein
MVNSAMDPLIKKSPMDPLIKQSSMDPLIKQSSMDPLIKQSPMDPLMEQHRFRAAFELPNVALNKQNSEKSESNEFTWNPPPGLSEKNIKGKD